MRLGSESLLLLLLGLVAGFVAGLLVASHTCTQGSVHSSASSGPTGPEAVINRIRGAIAVTPAIRDKALLILHDMAGRHSAVANSSAPLAPGERYCIPLSLYRWNRYRVELSSNSSVDVYLRGKGTSLLLATLAKRYEEWLRVSRSGSYEICVEAAEPANVRLLVEAWPPSNITNDPVFKTLAIAVWAAENLHYVSDPLGLDYVAPPEETLRTLSGDCDDFAVLLTSMYISVGLRSAVALIDTNNDGAPDHAATLVELPYSSTVLREKIPAVLQPLGAQYDGYTTAHVGNSTWLVIDPAMAYQGKEPWLVLKQPYKIIYIIKAYETGQR